MNFYQEQVEARLKTWQEITIEADSLLKTEIDNIIKHKEVDFMKLATLRGKMIYMKESIDFVKEYNKLITSENNS